MHNDFQQTFNQWSTETKSRAQTEKHVYHEKQLFTNLIWNENDKI